MLRRMALQRRYFSVSTGRPDTYGFVGLGQMGFQMAKNLREKLPSSDKVRIFDINKASLERFQDVAKASPLGGALVEVCETALDAAADADTVITVLPEPIHVRKAYSSMLDVSLPKRQDRVFIDCSTIDPSSSQDVATMVSQAGQGRFVDAPMSGGVVGASAGTLTFMLGSDASLVPHVESVLLRMGRRVLHCGGQGSGLAAKLANNYLLAVMNVATAEAMNLGMRCGLDPKTLAGVLNVSTGRCWPSEVNNPVPGVVEAAPAGKDYAGGFGLALMRKDLGLAMLAAKEAGARLELADKTKEVYDSAESEERCKGRDFSVVYRYLDGKE